MDSRDCESTLRNKVVGTNCSEERDRRAHLGWTLLAGGAEDTEAVGYVHEGVRWSVGCEGQLVPSCGTSLENQDEVHVSWRQKQTSLCKGCGTEILIFGDLELDAKV